jgi:hypothetical protein
MSQPRRFAVPPVWNPDQLDEARGEAIARFITARNAEGGARYQVVFQTSLAAVGDLFGATDDIVTLGDGAVFTSRASLLRAARYLGGPPVSADDLDTLAEARIAARKALDHDLAAKAARVIAASIDPERFPWLFASPPRKPSPQERDVALRWTAGLMAAQEVQTQRRGESAARQELAVQGLLLELGFQRVPTQPIDVTGGLDPGQFCHETLVAGVKCDIPVGLRDGRFLLLECKVSNSATNSVKRLNRECGGKADAWRRSFGERAIPGAVLAGVFKRKNLEDAQSVSRLTIFWEHDLKPLAAFLRAAS